MVHHVGAAAIRAQWQAATHDLAERRQVGLDAEEFLGAAKGQPEARHHLVADEERAVAASEIADRGEESGGRHHQPHVADHGLHEHGRDRVAAVAKKVFELLRLVVFEHQGVFRRAGGDAGRVWHAERGGRRAGRDQQAVGMAVIVAGKLHDQVAAREAAGQPDRTHRGLGAGTHHSHLLDRGHRRDDQFRKPALSLGRSPVGGAGCERPLDRRDYPRMPVAEDHRAPGADVVEIRRPIDIGEVLTLRRREEDRLATDAAECPGRRVDATGDQGFRAGEGSVALGASGGGAAVWCGGGVGHGVASGWARSRRASSTAVATCGRGP